MNHLFTQVIVLFCFLNPVLSDLFVKVCLFVSGNCCVKIHQVNVQSALFFDHFSRSSATGFPPVWFSVAPPCDGMVGGRFVGFCISKTKDVGCWLDVYMTL